MLPVSKLLAKGILMLNLKNKVMKFLCRNLIWIMIKIKLVFLVLVLGFSSLNAKVWSQQDRIDLVFENMNMVQLSTYWLWWHFRDPRLKTVELPADHWPVVTNPRITEWPMPEFWSSQLFSHALAQIFAFDRQFSPWQESFHNSQWKETSWPSKKRTAVTKEERSPAAQKLRRHRQR